MLPAWIVYRRSRRSVGVIMSQRLKPITYGKIENGEVTEQKVVQNGGALPEGIEGKWLPIFVETPVYNWTTHQEVRRENIIERDRIRRVRIIEPIPITPEMIKEECRKRIIALTGGGDLMGSLAKQLNAAGKFQPEIDRLRACSNAIEKMNPVPIDFRDEKYWGKS